MAWGKKQLKLWMKTEQTSNNFIYFTLSLNSSPRKSVRKVLSEEGNKIEGDKIEHFFFLHLLEFIKIQSN